MTTRRSGGTRPGAAVLVVAVLIAVGALVWSGTAKRTPTEEQRVTTIAAGLRCPVCTDLSAADSSAPLARQMRVEIRQQVAAGASDDEIRSGFVRAYGPSVLLSPPEEGIGRVAHVLPLLILAVAVLGGTAVIVRGRRSPGRARRAPEADPSSADRALVDGALAELLKEEA